MGESRRKRKGMGGRWREIKRAAKKMSVREMKRVGGIGRKRKGAGRRGSEWEREEGLGGKSREGRKGSGGESKEEGLLRTLL